MGNFLSKLLRRDCQSATRKALAIPELRQAILLNVDDAEAIWAAMGVSRAFRATILASPILEWRAFLQPSRDINETLKHYRTRKDQPKLFPHYQHLNCVNPMMEKPGVLLGSVLAPKHNEMVWAIQSSKKFWDIRDRKLYLRLDVQKIEYKKKTATTFFCSNQRLSMRVADPCVHVCVRVVGAVVYDESVKGVMKAGVTAKDLIEWLETPDQEKLDSQLIDPARQTDWLGFDLL